MTIYLLDVNVLLAFCDNSHIHHDAAHAWFSSHASTQWATCPITENGFLRIFGNPNYPSFPGPSGALKMLQQICNRMGHHFWSDSKSILEWLSPETVISPKQITDLYLLGLAAANGGKLATFDRTVPAKAVKGGAKALELLG